ncbi:MAG: hypothetical protein NWF05_02460 [Candidatus Bathyarchaeota archaeon]|nr:hypothetical protein [Candidatus Bathyarchaeota archaeon]
MTKPVEFKTTLRQGNRIQVPKQIRWAFKLDSSQVLQVAVRFDGHWRSREEFFGQMCKDGRITVPKVVCGLLKHYWEEDITGAIMKVEMAPSDGIEDTQEEN